MHKVKDSIMNIVKQYLMEANKICRIEKAFLFGSQVYGRTHPSSDIDIAIFSKEVTESNRLGIMTKLNLLILQFKIDIQPVAFSYRDYLKEDIDFISNEVKKKGIEIIF